MAGYEFKYSESFDVTDDVKRAYDKYGFIILKGLMDSEEVAKLTKALVEFGLVEKHSYGVPDSVGREPRCMIWSHPGNDVTGMVPRSEKVVTTCEKLPDQAGREPRMMLWSHPGNDVTGMVPRCEKVVTTCEKLTGGDELYHYHTKIMMKDPKKGGSFEWHQDYGYWYKNGCLAPDLISMFLAIDPCVKENGGLQVLVGSHKLGRIDHSFVEGQQGADKERVEWIKGRCEHMYINLQPGDALLFHCNLLHCSGPNDSEQRRWAFNCSFNKKNNDPVIDHHHPRYTKLHKVPNSAIKECNNFTDFTGKEFLDPSIDKTVKAGSKAWEEKKE